ncbi:MAG: hypothetical protein SGI83_07595 [Bacteroidota bacterium]|nr:hypothetical protein [Bacteroidota bacterium]
MIGRQNSYKTYDPEGNPDAKYLAHQARYQLSYSPSRKLSIQGINESPVAVARINKNQNRFVVFPQALLTSGINENPGDFSYILFFIILQQL